MPRPEGWIGSDLRARSEVVQWLHDHGDEVHDPSGLIVGRLKTDLNKGRAIGQLLADMERDGMIEREVRGRRTMMLKLVDDWDLLADLRKSPKGYRQVRPPVIDMGKDGDGGGTPNVENVDLTQLAETLLAIVLKRAAVPSETGKVDKLSEQLAKAKAEVKELRDALLIAREAEAEQRRQADKMRDSLAKLQRKIDKPKAGAVPLREHLDEGERKLLDSLMRSLPSSR